MDHAFKKYGSDQKSWSYLFCLFTGLGIVLVISLFVRSGISFILSLLNNLQLPKQVVVIYTSIFYGIVFFIARAGVRVKKRSRYGSLYKDDLEEEEESISGNKSMLSRARSLLWIAFGVISILLLTPALIVYWRSPLNPGRIIMICGVIFSLAGTGIFFIQNSEKIQSVAGRIMFFSGVISGILLLAFSG